MRRKPWQNPRFKALQQHWYRVIERMGFQDAEKTVGNRSLLKQNSKNSYRQAHATQIENKRRYYELLGKHFHDEMFQDNVDRLVMERRSQGVKIRQISIELEAMKERCHRQTIRMIIRKYEKKWGIR